MYQIKDDTPRLAHRMSVCFPSFALGHKHIKLEVTHSISFFLQGFRPREVVPASLRPCRQQLKP